MSNSYNIRCFDSFEAVKDIWVGLEAHTHHYLFQSFSWQHCWYQHIGHKQVTPKIIVVSQATDSAVMLLPLCLLRKHGLRQLTFMGGVVTDYHAPLKAVGWNPSDNEFASLWKQIMSSISGFDLIWFDKQPELINDEPNPLKPLFRSEMALSHGLVLDTPFEELYQSKISKRIKADSRRQLKRLNEIGKVEFLIDADEGEAEKIIETMIVQKRAHYKAMGVDDIFDDAEYKNFFTSLHENWHAHGKVHVSALSIDDEIIATHWGMVDKQRFYYLMPSYQAGDWGRFSAGRLLMEQMIKWSSEKNIGYFDFSFGDEAYKKSWCDTTVPLFRTVEANSPVGSIYLLLWLIREKLKSTQLLKTIAGYVRK